MKKFIRKVGLSASLLLLLVAASTTALERTQQESLAKVLCNYFPPNKMHFPVRNDGKQMTYGQFKKILMATEAIYKPEFARLGLGNFNVVDRWTDDDVNACASISAPCSVLHAHPELASAHPSERFVEIYGGLARHPLLTPEALMVVICHEIGHHLGGYPRYDNNRNPMATEGQADYFATSKCSRAVYAALNPKSNQNWAWTNQQRLPADLKAPCLANFPPKSEAAIYCARSSLAALSLAQVLATIGEGPIPTMSFTNKDPHVVKKTFEGHPPAQCRLDTYVAGAVCQVDPQTPFSPTDPNQGACVDRSKIGARPACWYKAP
jgi:hypothetical protein